MAANYPPLRTPTVRNSTSKAARLPSHAPWPRPSGSCARSPPGWHGSACTGRPTEPELHSLAAHQRLKLERYGNTLVVVLRAARHLDAQEEVEFAKLHIFVGPEAALYAILDAVVDGHTPVVEGPSGRRRTPDLRGGSARTASSPLLLDVLVVGER